VISKVRRVSGPVLLRGVIAVFGLSVPLLSRVLGSRTVLLLAFTLLLTGIAAARPNTSIPIAVGMMMFFALVRRVFPAPMPASDVAAIFPFIAAMPLAWRGLRNGAPISVLCFLGWSAATSVLNVHSPLVGAAGIVSLAVPMTMGLAAAGLPGGMALFRRTFAISAALAATYGIAQYLVAFSWDARWLRDAKFSSAGRIGTNNFRPFGTLPAPGVMAVVAAIALLLVVIPGSPVGGLLRVWVGASCGVVMLLSQVRSVWIATAAALILAAVGDLRRARQTITTVVLLSLVLIVFVPSRTTLVDRVKTLSNPTADRSYSARRDLLRSAGALLTPVGKGVGQYSAGNRIVAGHALDNGYLVVLGETGIVGFGLLLWVLSSAVSHATRRDYPFFVLLLLLNMAGFAVGGIAAAPLWSMSGLQRAGVDGASSVMLDGTDAPFLAEPLPTPPS
jgi:hypothetical protein